MSGLRIASKEDVCRLLSKHGEFALLGDKVRDLERRAELVEATVDAELRALGATDEDLERMRAKAEEHVVQLTAAAIKERT